jgi:hypothetical protein
VFRATGIRLSELAGIRYDPDNPRRSDIDLWQREITVRGKGGQTLIVRIGHEAARSLDRYIRVRSRHAQAYRPQLWLGVNNRAPMTANGIYQMVARRGPRLLREETGRGKDTQRGAALPQAENQRRHLRPPPRRRRDHQAAGRKGPGRANRERL